MFVLWCRILVLPLSSASTDRHVADCTTGRPITLTLSTEMARLIDIVVVEVAELGIRTSASWTSQYLVWLLHCYTWFAVGIRWFIIVFFAWKILEFCNKLQNYMFMNQIKNKHNCNWKNSYFENKKTSGKSPYYLLHKKKEEELSSQRAWLLQGLFSQWTSFFFFLFLISVFQCMLFVLGFRSVCRVSKDKRALGHKFLFMTTLERVLWFSFFYSKRKPKRKAQTYAPTQHPLPCFS